MGIWTRGIAAVAGIGVGLAVFVTGPSGSSVGTLAMLERVSSMFMIDGSLHEQAPSDQRVVVTRVVSAPATTCWDMWTTSEGIASFFAPESAIDLTVGGQFRVFTRPSSQNQRQGLAECKILSYVPNRMLSFEWIAPPHFSEEHPKFSRVVVLFEKVHGGTKVELIHIGFGQSEQWEEVMEYSELLWPQVMDRFATAIETT